MAAWLSVWPKPIDVLLAEEQWRPLQQHHRDRVDPWIMARLERRRTGVADPVDDFLWTYYRHRPAHLRLWHPGAGVTLAGTPDVAGHRDYRRTPDGWTPDESGLGNRLRRVEQQLSIVRATAQRPPQWGCFGMHEWAMVHGLDQSEVRHAGVGLRLSTRRIAEVVAEVGLRCTHFDAYRFFTPGAQRLQEPLTRAGQTAHEQPGCIHAGMDLYRCTYEVAAFVGSDLVVDCLAHARRARELDMRASPYDLPGTEPVRVETPAGRREYVERQRGLAEQAQILRGRVISALSGVVARARVPDRAQSR